jgi:phosphomethylpyrimidine synthase
LLDKDHAGCACFAAQGVSVQAALQNGMEMKSVEFVKQGAEVYHKA